MAERQITLEEFQEHQEAKNLWILLHGKVYDVAKFLDEHPGGEEVIVSEAGKDATEAFEDVGHSDEAREILLKYLIGTFADADKLKDARPTKKATPMQPPVNVGNSGGQPSNLAFLFPLALLVAYFAYRYYGA